MPLSAQILALVAAALHVLFFYLESVVFSKPSTWKGFGVESQEAADHIKPMALNQGFYNLFLAVGVVVGFIRIRGEHSLGSILEQAVVTSQASSGPVTDQLSNAGAFDPLGPHWGAAVIIFSLLCMLAAAIVLIVSSRGRLLRAALIQGAVPALALIITLVA